MPSSAHSTEDEADPDTNDRPACTYDEAWVGACGDPAVETDPPRCEDHADKTCAVCGDPAVKGCPATFGLVCGAALCAAHGMGDCPVHPR